MTSYIRDKLSDMYSLGYKKVFFFRIIPVTFLPCPTGSVLSGSAEGWPVPHGKLSPDPEETGKGKH